MVPSISIVPPEGDDVPDEPITVEEVKLQIRVDNSEEDSLLEMYIKAAHAAFVRLTNGRTLITTDFSEQIPAWDHHRHHIYPYPYPVRYGSHNNWRPLRLSRGPVTAIDTITYRDIDDAEQEFTAFTSDLTGTPALITTTSGIWPVLSCHRPRPITVTYTAGFGDAEDVPNDIKVALLSLVAHWYWQREAYIEGDMKSVPMAFSDFCSLWDTGLGGF